MAFEQQQQQGGGMGGDPRRPTVTTAAPFVRSGSSSFGAAAYCQDAEAAEQRRWAASGGGGRRALPALASEPASGVPALARAASSSWQQQQQAAAKDEPAAAAMAGNNSSLSLSGSACDSDALVWCSAPHTSDGPHSPSTTCWSRAPGPVAPVPAERQPVALQNLLTPFKVHKVDVGSPRQSRAQASSPPAALASPAPAGLSSLGLGLDSSGTSCATADALLYRAASSSGDVGGAPSPGSDWRCRDGAYAEPAHAPAASQPCRTSAGGARAAGGGDGGSGRGQAMLQLLNAYSEPLAFSSSQQRLQQQSQQLGAGHHRIACSTALGDARGGPFAHQPPAAGSPKAAASHQRALPSARPSRLARPLPDPSATQDLPPPSAWLQQQLQEQQQQLSFDQAQLGWEAWANAAAPAPHEAVLLQRSFVASRSRSSVSGQQQAGAYSREEPLAGRVGHGYSTSTSVGQAHAEGMPGPDGTSAVPLARGPAARRRSMSTSNLYAELATSQGGGAAFYPRASHPGTSGPYAGYPQQHESAISPSDLDAPWAGQPSPGYGAAPQHQLQQQPEEHPGSYGEAQDAPPQPPHQHNGVAMQHPGLMVPRQRLYRRFVIGVPQPAAPRPGKLTSAASWHSLQDFEQANMAAHACYSCFMEEDEAPLPVPGSMVAGIRAELQVVSQGFMMRKRQQQQQEEERSAAQETAAAAAADAAAAAEANADAAMQDAEYAAEHFGAGDAPPPGAWQWPAYGHGGPPGARQNSRGTDRGQQQQQQHLAADVACHMDLADQPTYLQPLHQGQRRPSTSSSGGEGRLLGEGGPTASGGAGGGNGARLGGSGEAYPSMSGGGVTSPSLKRLQRGAEQGVAGGYPTAPSPGAAQATRTSFSGSPWRSAQGYGSAAAAAAAQQQQQDQQSQLGYDHPPAAAWGPAGRDASPPPPPHSPSAARAGWQQQGRPAHAASAYGPPLAPDGYGHGLAVAPGYGSPFKTKPASLPGQAPGSSAAYAMPQRRAPAAEHPSASAAPAVGLAGGFDGRGEDGGEEMLCPPPRRLRGPPSMPPVYAYSYPPPGYAMGPPAPQPYFPSAGPPTEHHPDFAAAPQQYHNPYGHPLRHLPPGYAPAGAGLYGAPSRAAAAAYMAGVQGQQQHGEYMMMPGGAAGSFPQASFRVAPPTTSSSSGGGGGGGFMPPPSCTPRAAAGPSASR